MQRKVIKTVAAKRVGEGERERWGVAHFTMQQFQYAALLIVVVVDVVAVAVAVAVVILDYISCNVVAERAGGASNLLFLLILLNKILELNKLTHTHARHTHTHTHTHSCSWLVACSLLWQRAVASAKADAKIIFHCLRSIYKHDNCSLGQSHYLFITQ